MNSCYHQDQLRSFEGLDGVAVAVRVREGLHEVAVAVGDDPSERSVIIKIINKIINKITGSS